VKCPLAAAAEAASHSGQQPSRQDATAAGASAASDDHAEAAQAGAGQGEPPAHTALDIQVTLDSASPLSRCALVARRLHGARAVVSRSGRQLRVVCNCPQAAQPAQQARPQLLVEPGGGVSDDEEEDVEAVASKAHRVSSPLRLCCGACTLVLHVSIMLAEPPRGYLRLPGPQTTHIP
jgi:hypothetical protein